MFSNLCFIKKMGLNIQVVKTALGAGIAWALATNLTQNQYPYFAPLAAILVSQITVSDSIQRAINRVVGVILGVMVSMLIEHWMNLNSLSIFAVILVGTALATALKLNSQIISQVGVSSLLVLSVGHENSYAMSRIFETILGSVVAIVINAFIVPSNEIPIVQKHIYELTSELATTLKNLSKLYKLKGSLTEGLIEARKLTEKSEKIFSVLKSTNESLKYSPFFLTRKKKINHLMFGKSKLECITIEIRGIAKGLVDLGNTMEPIEDLVEAMEATANCIEIFGNIIAFSQESITNTLLSTIEDTHYKISICLTNLKNITNVEKALEIGSILADLNRIINNLSIGLIKND